MKGIFVRPLRPNEKRRFFEFAKGLPDTDFWGKKGHLLRVNFETFKEMFGYIRCFEPKCFFVAEEDNQLEGFVLAAYNPEWINELKERYGRNVDKRAHILGIAVTKRRSDVLQALSDALITYLSKKGITSVEYPSFGNVCLTTATDVLTPENVDALIMFREAGFKINECYYSMQLNLDAHKDRMPYSIKDAKLRFRKRSVEFSQHAEVLGKLTWEAVDGGKTSINICVGRAHRGKGIGTALMGESLRRLKAQGVRVVELGVDGNNIPALKLYRKFGFEVCKTHFYIIRLC